MNEILKNRLKQERLNLNIEQKDLADKMGISNRTISKYELGQAKPSYEILAKLADIFDCSIDYLLGRTDYRHIVVYKGVVDGNEYEFGVNKDEPEILTPDKFERLVRKLKSVGFDTDKLLENIDLEND